MHDLLVFSDVHILSFEIFDIYLDVIYLVFGGGLRHIDNRLLFFFTEIIQKRPFKDSDGIVQSFELVADDLQNINSIAKLDLTGETSLGGTAAELQSFTLLWNTSTRSFDEIIENVPDATIDVSDNAGCNSYISLLPNDDNVYLECSKGRYEFVRGIRSNQLYVGSYADDINDARPLHWE